MSLAVRKQLFQIEELLEKANQVIEKQLRLLHFEEEKMVGLLTDCQDSAISLGEQIEKLYGEGTGTVAVLEQYCETLYQLSCQLTDAKKRQELFLTLTKQTKKLRKQMTKDLPIRRELVFLPYKVAMWDSLESIWAAANADEDTDAIVVPIPYFDKNPDGSLGQMHYEGGDYPDNVPVVSYETYDFSLRRPDAVFIHNPYDDGNLVTTVHPHFYAKELKKYTDCLVYSPYYATTGGMGEGQSLCMAYLYADYIVIQAEHLRNYFDARIPDEKFLPLGSPKFDSVIRKCKNPPIPPADWQEKMQGKKVYFYNTSLSGMLENTSSFLQKMRYVFDAFSGRKDACLLWRPHPLLEATFDSMRKEYKAEFHVLKERFLKENLGILDTTPNIEDTIALSDAYVGDSGTSVTALFGVVGKPLFILNNRIHEKPKAEDWKGILYCRPFEYETDPYIVVAWDKLLSYDEEDGQYHFFCDLSKRVGGGGYLRAKRIGNRIYVFPRNAQDILAIEVGDEKIKDIRKIPLSYKLEAPGAFSRIFFTERYAFLIPWGYPAMIRFDFQTEQTVYMNGMENVGLKVAGSPYLVSASALHGKMLYLFSADGRRVLRVNTDTLENELSETGLQQSYVEMIAETEYETVDTAENAESKESTENENSEKTQEIFWLLPYEGSVVARWNATTKETQYFDLRTEGLESIHRSVGAPCNMLLFGSVMFTGEEVIFSPRWGNQFVKLNPRTGAVSACETPFEPKTNMESSYFVSYAVGNFFRNPKNSKQYRFFYEPERTWHEVEWAKKNKSEIEESELKENSKKAIEVSEIKVNESNEHDKNIRETEMLQARELPLTVAEDVKGHVPGFAPYSRWLAYCCDETAFYSLADFLDGKQPNTPFDREAQLFEFAKINASIDGDCGEKVYAFVKEKTR